MPTPQDDGGNQMKRMNGYTVALTGVLLATALLLGYVESLVPIPGIKLGLPNFLSLIVMKHKGMLKALAFGVLRVLLSCMLFGNVLSLVYALAGCIISVVGMWLVGKISCFSTVGQSITGGILHNVGQITAATLILGTTGVWWCAPYLFVCGAIAGFLTGIIAALIIARGKYFFEKY